MDKNVFYIGFDYSINKPAATICHNGKLYFYFWPRNLSEKKQELYAKAGVRVVSRNLPPVDKKSIKNSQLVLIHTIRSTDLANLIISDLDAFIEKHREGDAPVQLYVSSEGLSYASMGDAMLNLATYKGVLLSKIYEHYGDSLKRMFTYSPMTMKAEAGCAAKEYMGEKKPMIRAFLNEKIKSPLKDAIKNGDMTLKTNFVEGIDDLADSYWALQTMIRQEKLKVK